MRELWDEDQEDTIDVDMGCLGMREALVSFVAWYPDPRREEKPQCVHLYSIKIPEISGDKELIDFFINRSDIEHELLKARI